MFLSFSILTFSIELNEDPRYSFTPQGRRPRDCSLKQVPHH